MRADNLLIILVAVTALAFIIQCVAVWITLSRAREIAARLEKQSDDMKTDLQRVVDNLRQTAETLEQPVQRISDELNSTTTLLSQLIQDRAKDVDQFVKDMTQVGRDQAGKLDFVVTDTVQKFEQVTEVIQRDVLQPAIEISSLIKGLKSGLGFLFSRKAPRPTEGVSEEEELFI